ncbi:hypothetical protein V6N12_035150 [Hibiscus sabdariffa]|uniref:Uncharacterized protein n=1 Tax=Hibiscus sabdariffa TaxID=183260 RepID=A0ABR2AK98_9ROSI
MIDILMVRDVARNDEFDFGKVAAEGVSVCISAEYSPIGKLLDGWEWTSTCHRNGNPIVLHKIGTYMRSIRIHASISASVMSHRRLYKYLKQKIDALVSEIERTASNLKALDQYKNLQEKERDVTGI